jgi:hypothetical protein
MPPDRLPSALAAVCAPCQARRHAVVGATLLLCDRPGFAAATAGVLPAGPRHAGTRTLSPRHMVTTKAGDVGVSAHGGPQCASAGIGAEVCGCRGALVGRPQGRSSE